jgi:hypothetical protein
MPTESDDKPRRPWWVWLAIPLASARHRDVWVKFFVFTFPFAAVFGTLAAVWLFYRGPQESPGQWWVAALAALGLANAVLEVLAIRWTNQNGAWQR